MWKEAVVALFKEEGLRKNLKIPERIAGLRAEY